MNKMLRMEDLDLAGKRVLIREDLNVPLQDGAVVSDARIRAALPTLRAALDAGASVMVMSHLGRPTEGEFDAALSLRPVAARLQELLGVEVEMASDWRNWRGGLEPVRRPGLRKLFGKWFDTDSVLRPVPSPGTIALIENVRFNPGEKANADTLAQKYAALCDVFIMDAFGAAHRAQASTQGVARFAPVACAGPLLVAELQALERALSNPARPLLAIVGGAKVSTKLTVLETLADKVDQLVVGGGIANTFLAAAGHPVGQSLCERDLIPAAAGLLQKTHIPIPTDVVTAKAPSAPTSSAQASPNQVSPTQASSDQTSSTPTASAQAPSSQTSSAQTLSAQTPAETKAVADVTADDIILDLGPNTCAAIAEQVHAAGTVLWNGPLGMFELDQFGAGTETLSRAIAQSPAFTLAGGGDTLAAIDKYAIADKVSYISTGGGAFLEYVEGKALPAVTILEQRAEEQANATN